MTGVSEGVAMKTECLVLSCLARRDGDVWVAICLDFDLAAQGDSLEHVKAKLEEQIKDYVYDALGGEDKEHAFALLARKSPLNLRLVFWLLANIVNPLKSWKPAHIVKRIIKPNGFSSCSFYESLPMVPASRC